MNKEKYLEDGQGRMIPEEMVKPIDKLRDQTVRSLFAEFDEKSRELEAFRQRIASEVDAFVTVSAEQYGVKMGGKKGNLSLTSFDGKLKIEISNNDIIQFTEQLQVARELINKCINKWTEGSRKEIRVIIDNAFKTDKQGMISTSRVLGLRSLNIEDEDWQTAMQAITDSVKVVSSRKYLRFYEKNKDGKYDHKPLDVSSI